MDRKTPWIGTSWKMNKTRPEGLAFAGALAASALAQTTLARLFVIPPFTSIADVADQLAGTTVRVGAQNMHWAEDGPWTGEISARMIAACGATLVEIGHSERREFFNETDETVALKTAAAVASGLTALVCVGDTRPEFEAGETAAALRRQVAAALSRIDRGTSSEIVIAYEPVWSIGERGTPAEPGFVNQQHALIKALTVELLGRPLDIIYGGSVNPQNCCALASQPAVDGLFIGRSAWSVDGYLGIVQAVTARMAQTA